MILSRRVALNGQHLDELYGRIVIRGIEFEAPKENIQTISKMGGFGQRIASHRYETLDVVVKWAMDVPKKDLIIRRRIYDDVCRWAMQTGWLTVNFMPERRLWVDKTELSPAGDFRKWTEEYTITFRAQRAVLAGCVSVTDHKDILQRRKSFAACSGRVPHGGGAGVQEYKRQHTGYILHYGGRAYHQPVRSWLRKQQHAEDRPRNGWSVADTGWQHEQI